MHRAESRATEESYKEEGKIPSGGIKQLLDSVAAEFETQKDAYISLDIPSTETEVLKRMYNRYTDMMLAGFYVEGAQGRILAILDLKLSDAHELLRKGIVYTK
jgi:hypothetical protein